MVSQTREILFFDGYLLFLLLLFQLV